MKKLFTAIATIFMVTAFIMPAAAPAFADSDNTGNIKPAWSAALIIKAPNTVNTGQPLNIRVFAKHSQETIAGASVYALKAEEIVIKAGSENYTALMTQYMAVAKSHGASFGTTDNTGAVTGKLTGTGRFILVAVKDGYEPGFARVSATDRPTKGLNIRAPGSIKVDKPAAISVYERYTKQPVAGAAVYSRLIAVVSENATASARIGAPSKAAAASLPFANADVIKADPANVAAALQYSAEIKSTGTLLGYTGTSGQLTYTFTVGGPYILVATSDNYTPGLARISVRTAGHEKLKVKSPGNAGVGSPVNFMVTDRGSEEGIAGANLWALQTDDIRGTAESVWESLVSGSTSNEAAEKYRALAKDKGILLGTSSDSGQVTYVFNQPGRYLIVAFKNGYAPEFTQIKIGRASQQQIDIKAPVSATIGKQITIKAADKTGQPVENATIYAFRSRPFEPPMARPVPNRMENGTATQTAGDSPAAAEVSVKEVQVLLLKSAVQPITIGLTDAKGEVQYAFANEGKYVLTGMKEGYLSGGARISILSTLPAAQNSLSLKVPNEAFTGDALSASAFDSTGKGVAGAAIYSVRMELLQDVAGFLSGTPSADKAVREKYGAIVKARSTLLGYTDAGGTLTFNLSNPGLFMLLAVKDGYTPDFIKINIKGAVTTAPAASTTRSNTAR